MEKLSDGVARKTYEFLGYQGNTRYDTHLKNLGLVKGTTLYIVTKEKNQPLIIMFKGVRLGLDVDVARDMVVREKELDNQVSMVSLSQLAVGQVSRVVKLLGTREVKRRLLDMGLTKGTPIVIKQVAPLGDPIEIRVRNYDLTLRKQEAEHIMVEGVD
ncbi:hypothetical protein CBF34_03485 [Vagococcus penaei]|uniref:Ferrous iron transporter FeoA-like domain-containing protein n=1 Tax=Vagococcus penaei TaxID=633807 RepID=A0A1Q2D7C4_9ENTE|nr:ferrous iron transport protein A [Vagococcus penaei]AQP54284.1 hypothetical protein BW732_08645 [Vagococcus penaei]RSU05830.1 hypothetical protein CBF34_03485 [Vagococcus penaei]